MTVIVRQAAREDQRAIMDFLAEAYGPLAPFKGAERWAWQFLNNPAAQDSPEPSVWVAVDAKKVVGQIALQRTQLAVAGQVFSGGWIVDVMILPSHRGQGLGHRLYAAIAASRLPLITLTMAPATRRMADALGAITLPTMHQWTRIQRPDALDIAQYLEERTPHRPNWRKAVELFCMAGLTSVAATGLRQVSRLRDHNQPLARAADISITPVAKFDSSIDLVSSSLAGTYSLVPRTADYLNWRYVACPQLDYERYLARRGAKVVGYLVTRKADLRERRLGFIVDCMALDDDEAVWHALFSCGVERFGDVAAIETAASTPVTTNILRKLGFIRTRNLDPTIVCEDADILEALSSQKNWFFNKGDHDWDQIHLAPAPKSPSRKG
jgi:predicted N-acetyltransferase YhbS